MSIEENIKNSIQNEQTVLHRIRKFNTSLDKLMRLYSCNALESRQFFQYVTRETSKLMHVSRVSIWLLNTKRSNLECEDLYLYNTNEHVKGIVVNAIDFPNYFDAFTQYRVIDASHARTDRRTAEFTQSYLVPNNIFSLLDTQIRSASGTRGVVCIEATDDIRDWTPDEIAYAASIAEMVGFFIDRQERLSVQTALENANHSLEDAVAEAKLANERYNLAIDASYDGIWDWDLKNGEIYFSRQNLVLLGESADEVLPGFITNIHWWESRVHKDDIDRVFEAVDKHFKHDAIYNVMYRIRHQDGTWRWWRSRGRAVKDTIGTPIRFVGTNSDITDLIKAQQELQKRNRELDTTRQRIEVIALHDSLTGLPNRRFMERELERQLARARQTDTQVAVIHIDLDHFKEVNDSLGHAAGDHVLKHVASILSTLLDEHFVARIGGDEFVAIIPSQKETQPWKELSKQLIISLNKPIFYQNHPCKIGVSLGISEIDDNELTPSQILGNADIALYRAKERGRNRVELFNRQMRIETDNRRILHAEILQALDNNEFLPYFQPQFFASNLKLAGVEALARWKHPRRGILPPSEFLKAAEELGCVEQIDKIILDQAVAMVDYWNKIGLQIPRLSVNVSGAQLSDPKLPEFVKPFCSHSFILCFELLESIFLDRTSDQVATNLRYLEEFGVEIEVDDFGTGYASIASLINIRPQRLKIDGSLVINVEEDEKVSSLVRSIVDIARTLNTEVVAEGVETLMQIESLTSIGCQILQGYALGTPARADEFFKRYRNIDF